MGKGARSTQGASLRILVRAVPRPTEPQGPLPEYPSPSSFENGAELAPLLMDLANARDATRATACRQLGELDDERAVEILILALTDPSWRVRSQAAQALATRGDERAVAPLQQLLQDPTAYLVRMDAAEALGALGGPGTVEALTAALEDAEIGVRARAAESLGKLNEPRAAAALRRRLGQETEYTYAWQAEVEALRRLEGPRGHDPHLEGALALLRSRSPLGRAEGCRQLGETSAPQATKSLIAALKDPDAGVRTRAAEALGRLADPSALEGLLGALKDSVPAVRARALEALGGLKDKRANGSLIEALTDPDPSVRQQAAAALARRGSGAAVEPPRRLLERENENLAAWEAAASALERLGARPFQDRRLETALARLRIKNATDRGDACWTLGMLRNRRGVEPLMRLLKTETDTAVRARAIEALGQMEDDRALAALQEALTDRDPYVRAHAAHGLGRPGNRRAVAGLIALLRDSESYVRNEAVTALGNIGDPAAREPLWRLALQESPQGPGGLKPHLQEALEKLGSSADPESDGQQEPEQPAPMPKAA